MIIRAQAPGKMVITGEYAVLEGAPAVVMALDCPAKVELETHGKDGYAVSAPNLGIHAARAVWQGSQLRWPHATEAERDQLKLVTAVLEQLAAGGILPPPLRINLDTTSFFAPQHRGKLGVGSSAAITVALSGAVCALNEQPAPDLEMMLAMHRQIQGGRGSGIDIAASLHGGAIIYQLDNANPRWRHVFWPQDLPWCAVWSGRSASTSQALAHLSAWRQMHPQIYTECIQALTGIAEGIVVALDAGDTTTVLDKIAAYTDALDELGGASGIDIICDEHRALMTLAAGNGVVYKPCGAGGGDIGVAIARAPDTLAHFIVQATAAGYLVLDSGMDKRGLVVETIATSNKRQD